MGSGYREEKVKITENLKEDMILKEPDLLQQEESNIETLEVQQTEQIFEKAGNLFEKVLSKINLQGHIWTILRSGKIFKNRLILQKKKFGRYA